MTLTGSVRWV